MFRGISTIMLKQTHRIVFVQAKILELELGYYWIFNSSMLITIVCRITEHCLFSDKVLNSFRFINHVNTIHYSQF